MKEDATAQELENLLRDALKTGIESPGGDKPILQLKTVPLQVQPVPIRPATAPAPVAAAVAPAASNADAVPDSLPGLAEQLAPESLRPPPAKAAPARSRSSLVALLALGTVALAAAGGAAWLAREKHAVPVASAATTPAPSVTEGAAEGAVGIPLTARAPDAPVAVADEPKEAKNEAVAAAAPAVDTPAAEPPAPKPASAAPTAPTADAKDAKDAKVEVKPKPAAPKVEAKSEAKAEAKSEAKAASAEKAEKAEKKEPAPPAPASPPAGSVDALLQQQLKGAIP